jgi:hypothetical protein
MPSMWCVTSTYKRHQKQVEALTFDFKIAENTVFNR